MRETLPQLAQAPTRVPSQCATGEDVSSRYTAAPGPQLAPGVGPHSHLVSGRLQHPIPEGRLPGPLLHRLS